MKLNQEQFQGIKEGIEQGFIDQGYLLSTRESWIIELTLKTAIGFMEKVTEVDNEKQ